MLICILVYFYKVNVNISWVATMEYHHRHTSSLFYIFHFESYTSSISHTKSNYILIYLSNNRYTFIFFSGCPFPFGHGGEIALHYMMHEHGGFEGNGQTFRIITQLEPYTAEHGMNLCRRSVLGLVKYPNFIDTLTTPNVMGERPASLRQVKASQWHPPKGLFRCDEPLFDWLLAPFSASDKDKLMSFNQFDNKHSKTRFKSFDCSIMELADDIAYGIHDLEDAIVMDMVNRQDFISDVTLPLKSLEIKWLSDNIDELTDKLFSKAHHERKNAIGALVNSFITAIEIADVEGFEHPLLAYNAKMPTDFESGLELFKRFVYNKVIRRPDVQQLEYKGQMVVMELLEAFSSDPERLLPENTQERWLKACEQNNGMRVLADYISGMTDEFASRLYGTLFSPRQGGIQDNFHG